MQKPSIVKQLPNFPGGSKSRVNKAGENIRVNTATEEDLRVIEEWRAAHRAVLNTFQAILHQRARNKNITVAQRHKRKKTVFDKLMRQPQMNLSRMDDVAGCRLIFRNIRELYEFRKEFHKARFKHKRRNDTDKYDYIKSPKLTGYRGIHDVYEYDVNSNVGKRLTGLYVEIQYRTLIQHAWATANEVLGSITESQPKFQRGDERITTAMTLASEILARAHEASKGALPNIDDRALVKKFLTAEKDIELLEMLRGLNPESKAETKNKNTILIFKDGEALEVKSFRDAPDALRGLFTLENEHPDWDIVLVRAESSTDVRLAFKNYFSDARDFIELIETGCTKLTQTKNILDVYKPHLSNKQRVAKPKGFKVHKQGWNK
jgi:putative GTP pyrophosphokinase